MRAGCARRSQRVIKTLDLERRCEAGRNRAAHGLGNRVRTDLANTTAAQHICGTHDFSAGRAARGCNQAGADIRYIAVFQAGIIDGLLHRDVRIRRGIAHEPLDLAINVFRQVDIASAGYLAAQSHFGKGFVEHNAGTSVFQRVQNFSLAVAKTGNGPEASNHNTPHDYFLEIVS